MTSGSSWNYYRDEINDDANENAINRINTNKSITIKSFEYKIKLIGSTPNYNNTLDAEVVFPLEYLSNFWISLDLPLINPEIELDWSWSKEHIIYEISIMPRVPVNPDANPPAQEVAAIQANGVTFQINNTKLYVPVFTLSINDTIKFLGNIKQVFKRTFSWNKYRSEITTQPKYNNLVYLIDPTFRNIKKIVCSFIQKW